MESNLHNSSRNACVRLLSSKRLTRVRVAVSILSTLLRVPQEDNYATSYIKWELTSERLYEFQVYRMGRSRADDIKERSRFKEP